MKKALGGDTNTARWL